MTTAAQLTFTAILIGSLISIQGTAQDKSVFPGKTWMRADPERTGWNGPMLEAAKEYFEGLNADACVIIHKGYMIAAWGDGAEPIDCRSIRKSFLGTLIGIYHGKKMIRLDEDLRSIGIDENDGLTDIEKTATVEQLLSSRSGIFHPAAYDPNDHPPRGKYKPGEVWSYNNWDFNALGTIFEKKTGRKIFESFQEDIARPLQMEDFNMANTEYLYESKSSHAAYLFKTSARDDARIALLWMNKGMWNGKEIFPAEWIDQSTSLKTNFKTNGGLSLRDGFGYMFWIDKNDSGEVVGFSSLGNSGQFIYVNPEAQLIIVLRADPGSILKKWFGMRLDPAESYPLVDKIMKAKPR